MILQHSLRVTAKLAGDVTLRAVCRLFFATRAFSDRFAPLQIKVGAVGAAGGFVLSNTRASAASKDSLPCVSVEKCIHLYPGAARAAGRYTRAQNKTSRGENHPVWSELSLGRGSLPSVVATLPLPHVAARVRCDQGKEKQLKFKRDLDSC